MKYPCVWALTPAMRTSRFAAPWFCPMAPAKKSRVLVFAKGDKANEAQAAGADFVGAEDMVAKIQGGWFGFRRLRRHPRHDGSGRPSGPRPGPQGPDAQPQESGTVTMDVTRAVNDIKAGKVEYRVDKTAIIHCPLGKASFEPKTAAGEPHAR